MSDGDALMTAILGHPSEDTPRLVYADWLEETGELANVARASFIRLQIEAATTSRARRRDKLEIDADNLLHRWFPEWVEPVAKILGMETPHVDFGKAGGTTKSRWWARNVDDRFPVRWKWERGFIATLRLTAKTFMTAGHDLYHLIPLTTVTLSDVSPYDEPWRNRDDPPATWHLRPDGHMGRYAGAVAEPLWGHLSGADCVSNGYPAKSYANLWAAKQDLGAACLKLLSSAGVPGG